MPELLLYFSTAACWLLLSGLAWRASRPVLAGGPEVRGDMRVEGLVAPVALVLHAMLLYHRVLTPAGMDLGVANAISMLVWLTLLIYWLASLAYAGLSSILGMLAPVALVALFLQAAIPTHNYVSYAGDPLFTLHFSIAMLGYRLSSWPRSRASCCRGEVAASRVLPPF